MGNSLTLRGRYLSKEFAHDTPGRHVHFRRLLSFRRAILEMSRRGSKPTLVASLRRKARPMKQTRWEELIESPLILLPMVEARIAKLMKNHQRRLLKGWKEKARQWRVSDSAAFRFLKNPPPPSKLIAFNAEEGAAHPLKVQSDLLTYWNGIENWTCENLQHALHQLEDRYSIFLPRVECGPEMTPKLLKDVAKYTKKSSPGLDGWTHVEAAALPEAAWSDFLSVCQDAPQSLFRSLTAMYKRVPIPKHDALPLLPSDIRPIDVFSVLLRIHATAAISQIRSWTPQVLHPGQYASRKGVLVACANIAWMSGGSLVQCLDFWGVSVDFFKMLNMLSGPVAAQAAVYMGLAPANALSLLVPSMCSVGVWRLPYNAVPMPFRNTRGLPQGMATSVLLSELAIAPLLWRVGSCWPMVSIYAYVDDLNFASASRDQLLVTVRFLRQFEEDFALSLSEAKMRVWSSNPREKHVIEAATGFQHTNVLDALGGQWALNRSASPTHPREKERLLECRRRLARARTLPSPLPKLAHFPSVGCLSLLDYVNLPE